MNIKKILIGLFIASLIFSSCTPSPEELQAISAAETAAAATNTPIPTNTPVPTKTPIPTPTFTPTPLPDPDPNTMIDLEGLGLPVSFQVHSPDYWGIEKGAIAFGTGNNVFPIENSFVFGDDERGEIVFGFSALLPEPSDIKDVDEILADFPSWFEDAYDTPDVTLIGVSEIPGAEGIGDRSAGVRVEYTAGYSPIVLEQVAFRIGDILVSANVKNFLESTASLSVVEVAKVYARNINYPILSCELTNVKALSDEPWPTFNYLAEGFYPNESVLVLIEGEVEIGGQRTVVAYIDGIGDEMAAVRVVTEELPFQDFEIFSYNMDPLKVDNRGWIYNTIMQTGVEADNVVVSKEHQITVYGLYSGCSDSLIVNWE